MTEPEPNGTRRPQGDAGPEPGVERIAAAMRTLDGLEARPVAEHAEAYEQLHTALTDALTSIDEV